MMIHLHCIVPACSGFQIVETKSRPRYIVRACPAFQVGETKSRLRYFERIDYPFQVGEMLTHLWYSTRCVVKCGVSLRTFDMSYFYNFLRNVWFSNNLNTPYSPLQAPGELVTLIV
uniref:(northern house mosquito) hypothetical protein n=1 Tax=Culex pipiens TaxID=7175 RepID=A0A8D8HDN6_CULPI